MTTDASRQPDHVAIVGGGFSGTSALVQLVSRGSPRRITIFEKGDTLGPGYPYAVDESEDYLINNTADTMGIDPDAASGFVDWLAGHSELTPNVDPKAHYPRSWFGAYLRDTFNRALREANDRGIQVQTITREVTDLEPISQGVRVHYGSETTEVDRTILCTGRLPDRVFDDPPPAGSKTLYIPSHIPGPMLDSVALDATCYVLGASLSAYDVINRLYSPSSGCTFTRREDDSLEFTSNGNERRVVLCSRTAQLKKIQNPTPVSIERRHFTVDAIRQLAREGRLEASSLGSLVERDIANAGLRVAWSSVLDRYRDCDSAAAVNLAARRILESDLRSARGGELSLDQYLVDYLSDARDVLWEVFACGALSLDDELRYRERYETTLLSYFAACPIQTGERVHALMKAGRLRLVRGVVATRFDKDQDCYIIETIDGREQTRVLIQTTGSVHRDVSTSSQAAWTRALFARGLLRPYERDGTRLLGAAVNMSNFSLPAASEIYLANQLLWGPGFFVSSALTMSTIVRCIVDDIYGRAEH